MFERYIGIDYSGAQTPRDSLGGLRIYQASFPTQGSLPITRDHVAITAITAILADFPAEGRTRDQQDAFSIAEWMRRTDHAGELHRFLKTKLEPCDRATAEIEGWILGVEA